jgi:L-rhamnose isomerase
MLAAERVREGDLTARLVKSEEVKSLPFGAVWEMFCEQESVPGSNWLYSVFG